MMSGDQYNYQAEALARQRSKTCTMPRCGRVKVAAPTKPGRPQSTIMVCPTCH